MSFKLEAGKMYSAPIVFGPALCPVQNIDGNRYEVQEHVRQYTTVYSVDQTLLDQLLPAPMRSVAPHIVVRFERLTDVAWLAGRGFDRAEVLTPVEVDGWVGLFSMVTWENNGDSILADRDTRGRAKVYGKFQIEETGDKTCFAVASWAFTFLTGEFDAKPVVGAELPAYLTDNAGTFTYRQMPRTGNGFTSNDADYVVFVPKGSDAPKLTACTGSVAWKCATFEDAPTQYYFLAKLAGMGPVAPVASCFAEFDRTDDGFDQQIVR